MKIKIYLIAAITLLAASFAPAASAGEKAMGVHFGYTTHNNAPVGGFWFQYSLKSFLRVAPDVDYMFKHNDSDGFAINCNVQLPVGLMTAGRFSIYPLAGLNYTTWSERHSVMQRAADTSDVTTRYNRFGLNCGGGIEYYVRPTMKLSIEGKAVLIRHHTHGAIFLGLGYVF